MKRKTIAGVIAIVVIASVAIFAGYVKEVKLPTPTFTPQPGEYLPSREGVKTKVLLIDSHLKYGFLGQGLTTGPPVCPISAKEGDPCIILNGTIKNEYDSDYCVCISADVYNSEGEKVGHIVDPPVCSFTVSSVRSGHIGYFELHVKYDKKDVVRYDLFAFVSEFPPP